MNNQLHKLSALTITKINKKGRYNDGGGLYLQILENKSGGLRRSWLFRYKYKKVEQFLGLGPISIVALSEARNKAQEYRRLLFEGIDPRTHREQEKIEVQLEAASQKTFRECAEKYIEANKAGWKNEKHAKQWSTTLQTYAYDIIGDMPVAQVTTNMVVDILSPIWTEKASTTNRLRGRIETVLDWAKVMAIARVIILLAGKVISIKFFRLTTRLRKWFTIRPCRMKIFLIS